MTNERLLEANLLYHIINDLKDSDIKQGDSGRYISDINGDTYNLDKMVSRLNALLLEFVNPYAIDNPLEKGINNLQL